MNKELIVIGVGGTAHSGKDTFVKIARKILAENGYTSEKLAFADALKWEVAPFIKTYYDLDVWSEDVAEKTLMRPLFVAHGCQKRIQTGGTYWINKLDKEIETKIDFINRGNDEKRHVIFVSDCRFPNEVDWIHDWQKLRWSGWFVHLKKYSLMVDCCKEGDEPASFKEYNKPANEEETKNDPICEKNADYRLELENVVERRKRLKNEDETTEISDDVYLNKKIKSCLKQCPFLTLT